MRVLNRGFISKSDIERLLENILKIYPEDIGNARLANTRIELELKTFFKIQGDENQICYRYPKNIDVKYLGHLLDISGFYSEGKLKLRSDGKVSASKAIASISLWNHKDFLLVHLHFLLHLYAQSKNNASRFSGKIKWEEFEKIIKIEIWICANSFLFITNYPALCEDKEKIKGYIRELLKFIHESDKDGLDQFSIPCGTSSHAIYLIFVKLPNFSTNQDEIYIRIDNFGTGTQKEHAWDEDSFKRDEVELEILKKNKKETSDQVVVKKYHPRFISSISIEDLILPEKNESLINYLVDVCRIFGLSQSPDTKSDETSYDIIYGKKSSGLALIGKDKTYGYSSYPEQAVDNCVTYNYLVSAYYRWKEEGWIDYYKWLLTEERTFTGRDHEKLETPYQIKTAVFNTNNLPKEDKTKQALVLSAQDNSVPKEGTETIIIKKDRINESIKVLETCKSRTRESSITRNTNAIQEEVIRLLDNQEVENILKKYLANNHASKQLRKNYTSHFKDSPIKISLKLEEFLTLHLYLLCKVYTVLDYNGLQQEIWITANAFFIWNKVKQISHKSANDLYNFVSNFLIALQHIGRSMDLNNELSIPCAFSGNTLYLSFRFLQEEKLLIRIDNLALETKNLVVKDDRVNIFVLTEIATCKLNEKTHEFHSYLAALFAATTKSHAEAFPIIYNEGQKYKTLELAAEKRKTAALLFPEFNQQAGDGVVENFKVGMKCRTGKYENSENRWNFSDYDRLVEALIRTAEYDVHDSLLLTEEYQAQRLIHAKKLENVIINCFDLLLEKVKKIINVNAAQGIIIYFVYDKSQQSSKIYNNWGVAELIKSLKQVGLKCYEREDFSLDPPDNISHIVCQTNSSVIACLESPIYHSYEIKVQQELNNTDQDNIIFYQTLNNTANEFKNENPEFSFLMADLIFIKNIKDKLNRNVLLVEVLSNCEIDQYFPFYKKLGFSSDFNNMIVLSPAENSVNNEILPKIQRLHINFFELLY